MPWSLSQRDGKWCVVKQGASAPVPGGCHSSRTDAIKHQRALYANESRMASMYVELDANTEEFVESKPAVADVSPLSLELVSMLARAAEEKALTASVAQEREEQQRAEAQEERQALVAALGRLGSPVINLPEMKAPDVTVNVPPAEVNFTVPPAEINVHVPPAEVNVQSPEVNVTVEAPAPVQKTVTFERDPLTHEVVKAEVTET